MTNFVLKRLGQGAISMLLLLTLIFFLGRLTGDPLDLLLPLDAPLETIESVSREHGLDKPVPVQFGYYLGNLLSGDMGESLRYGQPVWELFSDAFPNTLKLILPAFACAILLGLPLGVLAATSKHYPVRRLAGLIGVVGMATPMFLLGVLLIYVFSVRLALLPSAQMGGITHYVLPVTALSVFLVAGLLRLVRSAMLDSMDADYVKLARLKGLPERRVVWKHALRNSLTAAVAHLSVLLSLLFTGSTVIETVFAWPGVGRLVYDALISRDYPLVQGIILLTSGMIILVNIFVDVLHAYVDPRIRL